MSGQPQRELTRDERVAIRKLVVENCANYDNPQKLCLPLDCSCYMLNKWWTGALCRYFQNAVLPLNPVLEASIIGKDNLKPCEVCGGMFAPVGRQLYCSAACRAKGLRKKHTERQRKYRQNGGAM